MKKITQNRKLLVFIAVCLAVFIVLAVLMRCMYSWSMLRIIRYLILAAGLSLITVIDWKQRIIPNKILLVMAGIRLLLLLAEWAGMPEEGPESVKSALIGALIGGGLFGLCYLLSRGGLGAGDVKLMLIEGFFLGNASVMPVLIIIAVCSAAGSLAGLMMKKVTMKTEVPFAPYVFIGTLLSMALGV